MVDGERWERLRDVAAVVPGRSASTVRAWVASGRVRSWDLRSGEVWVCVGDVLRADARAGRRRRRTRR